MASFLPFVITSGICWPIEGNLFGLLYEIFEFNYFPFISLGMPFYLRAISYSMPMTYPIESLRCIFSKGWGVNEFDVYAGIVISTIWIFGLIILCLIVTRFRKYSS